MRSLFLIVVLSLLLLPFSLHPYELKTINVVIDNNYPPYSFLNEEKQIDGFSIDLWKLFEEKTGIKVNIDAKEWSLAQEEMIQGNHDVIDTVFRNPKREIIYDFSSPYERVDTFIFYHKNITGINNLNKLKGFQIATKKGGATITYLQENKFTNIKEFNSDEEMIISAKNAETTVFAIGINTGYYFLYKYGVQKEFKIMEKPIFSNYLHRAVKKGNKDLLYTINNGFSKISQEEIDNLREKWFGKYTQTVYNYKVVVYTILSASLVIFILLYINYYLKKTVSERTKELEIEKEKFITLFNNSDHMMGLLDRGGNFIIANDTTYETFNLKKNSLNDKNISELPIFKNFHENMEILSKGLRLALDGEKAVAKISFINRETGTTKYFHTSLIPIKKNSETIYIIAEGKDITEHIDYVKEMEKIKAAKNIEMIIAGLAHDFNNLLAGINNYISIMDELNKDENVATMIEKIRLAYKRVTNLTRQILSFAKGVEPNYEDTDIYELLKNVINFNSYSYKDINIKFDPPKDKKILKLDPNLISQVFENLIINGIQSMDEKGTLTIYCSTINENDKMLIRISIKDEGCGIPDSDLHTIFQPLYTTKKKGNGLGLYMARLIIEKHSGFIKVESEVNKGTTFHIYLPL
ncbi:MAG: transporter substrate-binding domain-containing protein [Calditerrivibrio sp.]|nr:transporter substrate-binding domain-containing protein [Calditerrivibrio sp.]